MFGMLKRFYLGMVMAVLFAISQAGIITHAISHYPEQTQQSQPDQDQHSNELCSLCLSFAHVAGAMPATTMLFQADTASAISITAHALSIFQLVRTVYAARAPPAFMLT